VSDLLLPNASLRVLFLSMEDVMGPNGVSAVLNAAGLSRFVKNYPPTTWTTVCRLKTMPRSSRPSRIFMVRARPRHRLSAWGGRRSNMRSKSIPPRWAWPGWRSNNAAQPADENGVGQRGDGMTKDLNEPAHVEEQADHFLYVKQVCGACQGRKADKPVCFTLTGRC